MNSDISRKILHAYGNPTLAEEDVFVLGEWFELRWSWFFWTRKDWISRFECILKTLIFNMRWSRIFSTYSAWDFDEWTCLSVIILPRYILIEIYGLRFAKRNQEHSKVAKILQLCLPCKNNLTIQTKSLLSINCKFMTKITFVNLILGMISVIHWKERKLHNPSWFLSAKCNPYQELDSS